MRILCVNRLCVGSVQLGGLGTSGLSGLGVMGVRACVFGGMGVWYVEVRCVV